MDRKDNDLNTPELHHKYFPWKYARFWELVLDDAFQSCLNIQKNIFKVNNIVKHIAAIDVISMSLL